MQRRDLLILAVLSSAAAIACGWMLSTSGGYEDDLLKWHKWGAIGFGALCLLALLANFFKATSLYRLLLVLANLVLIPAAHEGASMTHGKDYLVEYAPAFIQRLAGYHADEKEAKEEKTAEKKDPQQAVVFADVVQPIIEKNCIGCHGADKQKGELRLDSFNDMKKGGKNGPAIVPGDVAKSLLLTRVNLPTDQKGHMPPNGKPQLSEDQISLIGWWIESGASTDKTVAQMNPPAKVADVIGSMFGVEPPKEIEPAPLKQIAPKIAQLKNDLHVVIVPTAVDQPQLEVNTSLAKSFTDSDLEKLTELGPNIVDLDLAGTKVTDSGLSQLAKMPNLQRLRLDRTTITDSGIAQLSKLRKLEYLNVTGTQITDASLKTFRGLPSIKQLYIWRTKIDPAAANAFADALIDRAKIRKIKEQIAALQSQLDTPPVAVYAGIATSKPSTTQTTTKPATTRSATKPATTRAK